MTKFTYRAGRRYASLLHHVRKSTTSRSRRIFLANVFCAVIFVAIMWLSSREKTMDPIVTATKGNGAGEVYYISKRALCSRSIAHSELNIQPIAVSKVVLRPIIRDFEGSQHRLEVLDTSLINDVIFLDRNISDVEAELGASICPFHTVSTLPPRHAQRYAPATVIFGCALTIDEIPFMIQHWRYWVPNSNAQFHVLLPKSNSSQTAEAAEMFRAELGIDVKVDATQETDDMGKLYLLLIQSMSNMAFKGTDWFVILSKDTFVTSMDDILLALEPYDATYQLYMGG
jgi:hypothetical protein